MKKTKKILLLLIFLASIFSCASGIGFGAPYVIENPQVKLGKDEENCNFAEMRFSLSNDTGKTVKSFTISFSLYDSEGNNPLIGSNSIVSRLDEQILPMERSDFIINLAPYISDFSNEQLCVDFVYLREISYTDGTLWKDPFGMYCVNETMSE